MPSWVDVLSQVERSIQKNKKFKNINISTTKADNIYTIVEALILSIQIER